MNQATHRVGLAGGAALAGALITLAAAPTAGADPAAVGSVVTADQFSDLLTGEGTQADQAVDNLYQGIANFFSPEAAGNAATADLLGMSTGEGSLADQAVDNFYQGIADFFSPEATGNMVTADQFSDLLTGEGTLADQMLDGLYQSISMAFAPEGPVDVFFDSLFGVAGF